MQMFCASGHIERLYKSMGPGPQQIWRMDESMDGFGHLIINSAIFKSRARGLMSTIRREEQARVSRGAELFLGSSASKSGKTDLTKRFFGLSTSARTSVL
jgi:hypothetical protein